MIRTIKTRDGTVRFKDTQKIRDSVFEDVIDFFVKHESFHGDSIMQRDDPQVYAPELLAKIADKLKFVEEEDE